MSIRILPARSKFFRALSFPVLLVLVTLALGLDVAAQQKVSKRFPVGKSVRLVLKNISGKVTVESWNRSEVKVTAILESSKITVTPKQVNDGVLIDVVNDNRGRSDMGNVNFQIQVPQNFTVDIETIMGDISISNIRGDMVRAYVSSEGDIELRGIVASKVYAQNMSGNIFFDGEVSRGGNYQFKTSKGDISISIPADSTFDLTASAADKRLALGEFWKSNFRTVGGEGQKYSKTIGDINDGRAKVTIVNFRGGITFVRR